MKHSFPLLAAASLFLAPPALADQVFADDVIVDGNLCVGFDCVNGENFGFGDLKIKQSRPEILLEDTSVSDRDWVIAIDLESDDAFSIRDMGALTFPFVIEPDAGSNRIYIDGSSRIGMGTSLPQSHLHVVTLSTSATLRLEETAGTPQAHEFSSNNGSGLYIRDVTANTFPFYIGPGAPDYSIVTNPAGNIGLGTYNPEGKLHTKGDGVQLAYFESGDGGPVQVRFRTDSENRRFLAVNNANQVKSQIIFKDNEILFTGATDSGANRWLTIGPSGILSQGGTCNVNPCDRTFDPEYFTVPPIAERAEYMWDNMHLPAIGPTKADEPINLTEKTTGIIHELEVAHIYIEELNARINTQQAQLDAQAAFNRELLARLDAMEND